MSRPDPIIISAVIITYKRLGHLKECLESIYAHTPHVKCQDLTPDPTPQNDEWEMVVIVNGDDHASHTYLEQASLLNPNLRLIPIERMSNGGARNEALKHTSGEIIYFLDDDIIVDRDIIGICREKFGRYVDTDIIGGPNLTPPAGNLLQKCSGHLLVSPFGSANVRRRYVSSGGDRPADDKSLILCNLAIRRKLFVNEKVVFDEKLVCNEENLLMVTLASRGYAMLHTPDLVVYHRRRATLTGFAKQFFKYGCGRGQMTRRVPRSFSPYFILPSLFIVYLISLIFSRSQIYLFPLFSYFVLNVFFSFLTAVQYRDIRIFPCLFLLFPVGHVSYGLGFLRGLVK